MIYLSKYTYLGQFEIHYAQWDQSIATGCSGGIDHISIIIPYCITFDMKTKKNLLYVYEYVYVYI